MFDLRNWTSLAESRDISVIAVEVDTWCCVVFQTRLEKPLTHYQRVTGRRVPGGIDSPCIPDCDHDNSPHLNLATQIPRPPSSSQCLLPCESPNRLRPPSPRLASLPSPALLQAHVPPHTPVQSNKQPNPKKIHPGPTVVTVDPT
jgi:hypothetical protein